MSEHSITLSTQEYAYLKKMNLSVSQLIKEAQEREEATRINRIIDEMDAGNKTTYTIEEFEQQFLS